MTVFPVVENVPVILAQDFKFLAAAEVNPYSRAVLNVEDMSDACLLIYRILLWLRASSCGWMVLKLEEHMDTLKL